MVCGAFSGDHRAAAAGLAGDPGRPRCADLRAHRLGQNAGGVSDRLDALVRQARGGRAAESRPQIVYVSPLKALSNDIHKNLEIPLAEIAELARDEGIALAPIRTAVRTGDTPAAERQQMSKQAAAHSGDHAGIALHSADGREAARRCCASVAR